MNIHLLPYKFEVAPLLRELDAHPALWDEYRWRTEHPRSPHRDCSDIWCRYNALENLGPRFNDEHESVWYPVVDSLPSVKTISEEIAEYRQQPLAGVLITKVPSYGQVYPHIDRGWHAENTDKVGVLVWGNRRQHFCFDETHFVCEQGESFWFRNQSPHWVVNPTDEDRITLIVCLRKH